MLTTTWSEAIFSQKELVLIESVGNEMPKNRKKRRIILFSRRRSALGDISN